jgi:hypothetical protein
MPTSAPALSALNSKFGRAHGLEMAERERFVLSRPLPAYGICGAATPDDTTTAARGWLREPASGGTNYFLPVLVSGVDRRCSATRILCPSCLRVWAGTATILLPFLVSAMTYTSSGSQRRQSSFSRQRPWTAAERWLRLARLPPQRIYGARDQVTKAATSRSPRARFKSLMTRSAE